MTSTIILTIIGLSCFTNIFIEATPMRILKEKTNLSEKKSTNTTIHNLIIELLDCALCLGFWVGVLYFSACTSLIETIIYASIVSVLAEFINRKLN